MYGQHLETAPRSHAHSLTVIDITWSKLKYIRCVCWFKAKNERKKKYRKIN